MNVDSFETVVVETDLLILGGGMAACGAAYEASYWAKKHKQRVTVVDGAQWCCCHGTIGHQPVPGSE